ncbi:hypothetical protein Bbelb_208640 [Branchiostoma belcheri]|nr:hypothetical protein Bbelb_208640 [Branchiostoma belcheri]
MNSTGGLSWLVIRKSYKGTDQEKPWGKEGCEDMKEGLQALFQSEITVLLAAHYSLCSWCQDMADRMKGQDPQTVTKSVLMSLQFTVCDCRAKEGYALQDPRMTCDPNRDPRNASTNMFTLTYLQDTPARQELTKIQSLGKGRVAVRVVPTIQARRLQDEVIVLWIDEVADRRAEALRRDSRHHSQHQGIFPLASAVEVHRFTPDGSGSREYKIRSDSRLLTCHGEADVSRQDQHTRQGVVETGVHVCVEGPPEPLDPLYSHCGRKRKAQSTVQISKWRGSMFEENKSDMKVKHTPSTSRLLIAQNAEQPLATVRQKDHFTTSSPRDESMTGHEKLTCKKAARSSMLSPDCAYGYLSVVDNIEVPSGFFKVSAKMITSPTKSNRQIAVKPLLSVAVLEPRQVRVNTAQAVPDHGERTCKCRHARGIRIQDITPRRKIRGDRRHCGMDGGQYSPSRRKALALSHASFVKQLTVKVNVRPVPQVVLVTLDSVAMVTDARRLTNPNDPHEVVTSHRKQGVGVPETAGGGPGAGKAAESSRICLEGSRYPLLLLITCETSVLPVGTLLQSRLTPRTGYSAISCRKTLSSRRVLIETGPDESRGSGYPGRKSRSRQSDVDKSSGSELDTFSPPEGCRVTSRRFSTPAPGSPTPAQGHGVQL